MSPPSRRKFLATFPQAAVAPFVLRRRYRVFAQSTREYPERVVRLMRESLVIDMLNQFLYRIDQRDTLNKWLTVPGAFSEADFLRFKNTGVNVINFGSGASDFPSAQREFAQWNAFIQQYPQWLMRISNVADLARARKQGLFGIIFGMQSSAQFETLDDIDHCFMAGQRLSQLSYNSRTLVADGAFEPHDAGVSEYGEKVVARMNHIGMAIDLGHASDKTKLDALALSTAPVILSHGNCRALVPNHLRATTDEAIRKLAAKGGVMGITDVAFMVKPTDPVSVDDVVDHYNHIRDLVGIEHVGVGSDAGIESNDLGAPNVLHDFLNRIDSRYHRRGELEDVLGLQGSNRMCELTSAFVRRGYTDEHVRLVIGGNWARVLAQIWHT